MRTEKEVLKDFEKLGYEVIIHNYEIILTSYDGTIYIYKVIKTYSTHEHDITLEEHKLLNELFSIWGWL